MSLPPINPEKTPSGISVDPRTLDRVIASSKRADGSVRKELKVRPGFTPQEDVGRFRSARQQIVDTRKAGPRVVPGWAPPPPAETTPKKPKAPKQPAASGTTPTKSTTKKEKKAKAVAEPVKDSWEEEEELVGLKKDEALPSTGDQNDASVDELTKGLDKVEITKS